MSKSNRENKVRVWDRPVRLLHWSLVAAILAAWITRHRTDEVHQWFGYATAAVIALRIVWGFIGSPYARFKQFVRAPRATLQYARTVFAQHTPRYVGHNPLGGWMIVTLLVMIAVVDFTGWLFTTDAFWGYKWLSNLHTWLAWGLVACAAVHVFGVVLMSLRHRENLVAAMFSGNKVSPHSEDIA